jgi:hypothetical protein
MRTPEELNCGAVYPGEPHGQLTCLKPWGHEDEEHATCLGYHPEWQDDNGLLHEGEYEWAYWKERILSVRDE